MGLFQAVGVCQAQCWHQDNSGAWPGWCQHRRQAAQSGPLGRRLDSELGYFKLTVAHQKGHLPAQLLLPLGSCEGGRGEMGFCSFFQDIRDFR